MLKDIHYAVRSLLKKPGFTVVAVATLALGIGVNAALFTGFHVFMRPEPVKDPDTIVRLNYEGGSANVFSFADYEYMREHTRVFSDLIAEQDEKFLLGEKVLGREPEEIHGTFISENFLSMLGDSTRLGRVFTAEENTVPGLEPVVVLSHRFWQRRFAGDPQVIGRTILLDGKPFTVIGVTNPSFVGLKYDIPDLWLPLSMRAAMPTVYFEDTPPEERDWFGQSQFQWLTVHGRLKPGKSIAEARTEMATLLPQLPHPHEERQPDQTILVASISEPSGDNSTWRLMTFVLGASGLILLIVCSNLANMMLARGASRQKEMSIRLCLGASRWRLVRQLLIESFILSGAGGIAGVLCAWWSLDLFFTAALSRYGNSEIARLALDVTPDARVLGFSLMLAALSSLVFGLAPALTATRPDLFTVIKNEGSNVSARSTRSWLRNGLVVVQVSVCVVLLIAAGLLVRSLQKVLRSNPGFESARLLSVGYSLELSNYNAQRAQLFQQQLMEKLAALPGVQSVCVDRNFGGRATMTVLNEPGSSPRTFDSTPYEHIPAHYLETIGTPVVAGRYFTEEEAHSKAPVVIVSESTARTVWPDESALGKTVRLDRRLRNGSSEMVLPMARVVGVARDNQRFRIGETPQLYFYRPDSVAGELDTALLVRASGDAAQLKEQARKAAYELEPVLRLFVETVEESIAHDNKVQATRAASEGGSALGVLALLLAAIGIYGVMAWTVAQRTREIGIRMALGARGGNVLALVLRHGLKMILFGLALGLTAAVAVTRLMSGLLFGLSPTDPLTFAGVAVLLIAIGLFACYIPARRATKVDPLIALRYE